MPIRNCPPKGVYVSADIYGLVGSVTDDMGLGQYWGGYQQCGGLCKPYDVPQPLRQPHLSIAGTSMLIPMRPYIIPLRIRL